MALTNGYTTVAALKTRLGNIADDRDNAKLEQVIEAASREIDGLTNRVFYTVDAQARTFTAEWGNLLIIDDLVSLDSIETDDTGDRSYGTTWAATDYDLEPENAAVKGIPYTSISITPNGRYVFPRSRRGVRITGDWGWPAVPKAIEEACLLISVRLVTRSKAPFGVAGSTDTQVTYIPRNDPDARLLIEPYRRMTVGAA
jgi:hypothetical protein